MLAAYPGSSMDEYAWQEALPTSHVEVNSLRYKLLPPLPGAPRRGGGDSCPMTSAHSASRACHDPGSDIQVPSHSTTHRDDVNVGGFTSGHVYTHMPDDM